MKGLNLQRTLLFLLSLAAFACRTGASDDRQPPVEHDDFMKKIQEIEQRLDEMQRALDDSDFGRFLKSLPHSSVRSPFESLEAEIEELMRLFEARSPVRTPHPAADKALLGIEFRDIDPLEA
ncbi:MAG TPA: hypothetical protein ENN09_00970, partial [Planctomycetes bacterium]|nr:hypothetical protein [Planctomycetota bacterium]